MNQNKKNRIVITITTIIMLLAVTIISVTLFIESKKDNDSITMRQLYVSDNELRHLIDDYFYTKTSNDTTIIKADKYEINIPFLLNYDNIYKLVDGKYVLYQNKDNHFTCYIFDGKELKQIYDLNEELEPLIFNENNKTYLIGFKKHNEKLLYYPVTSTEGIELTDIDDIIAVNKDYYLIKNNNKYGIMDTEGNIIIKPIYNNIEIANNNIFIVQNNKKLYGIIDNNEKIIITFKYNYITKKDKYYLIVNSSNKLALMDESLNTIIDYQMNYNQLPNSLDLYENDNKLFIINNKNEKNKNIKYQYHNMYVIENKKIKETIDEEQVFGSNNYLYYIKNNNLLSYDNVANLKINNASEPIINAKKINDNLIEITTYDGTNEKHKYFDKQFKEIIINNKDIIYNDENILIFSENDSLLITDINGNEKKHIKDTNILYNGKYVIIENCLYKIIFK